MSGIHYCIDYYMGPLWTWLTNTDRCPNNPDPYKTWRW